MHRNYFLKWWFQGIGPQLISTYGLAHKTNNVCESLHKKMSLKLAKASTIWRFLSDLRMFVIEPAKIDVLQLDNNIRIRRNIKLSNQVAARTVKNQEERLANGEITPIQHLHFMAHRVPTPVLPNDPDQDEADAELAAEMATDGYADDEDGDDEVFDEHGDDDAFLAAAGPQADGQQQPGHAAAGPTAAGPAAEPCCICMASPKDTILLPCGHVCVCSTCAALLEAQGLDDEPEGVYLCPVCRTRVTSRHRLFYA
nr:uncharacterized protein LOC124812224 [Hydra vulgaris]